ncbi:MAG: TonB-dependent receptor [Sphingomonas bacterium]|uniref:TonB-dependent receptor domain-containing protein n=1 Tax=Sphingomonas bacterium TaxID=1895847 RepID=UPI00261DB3EF|nr:TonB-dependent receptor [Sphingomonas bacterium]MDB5696458.1 TonB-dependent receptor [Sphingomonas bacterium]
MRNVVGRTWLTGVALAALLPVAAHAQVPQAQTTPPGTTPTGAQTPTDGAGLQANDAQVGNSSDNPREVLVTGSRIKQDPNNSALPLQIVTTADLAREGINSPEQLISFLSTNGNGADNLSSNSDVTSGAQRGTNGLSAANLRGQGSASTLVLLNGRRVAAHGLTGSAVDVNQIPFAAIDRVEVLKDGASAIYGTDAIGGVINFITKKDFRGLSLQGFTDITERGDSPVYRLSATAGYGDLASQGFNIMGAVSKSWNGALFGRDRDFVNSNQPNRGLSADTRGTPIATAFPINPTAANVGITQNGTLLGGTTGGATGTALDGTNGRQALFIPGTTILANGGINFLDLPGGAGCESVEGGFAYDEQLWQTPSARFACAYDTGRAAVLQQPIETLTYYARGTMNLGKHQLFAEVTGSDANSSKRFSENQYSANNTSLPIAYPLNALTAATYNDVYSRIAGVFPAIGAPGDRTVDAVGNYGKPITFRYRCTACGTREYETTTETFRGAIGAEGPLVAGFDYRVGASYAKSESSSVLGSGYHYTGVYTNTTVGNAGSTAGIPGAVVGGVDTRAPTAPGATAPGIVGLFNSGILNPFSVTQSAAALAGLEAVSARGAVLYGGRYEVTQFDGSVAGRLFALPGGDVQVALGVDYRRESYRFNGSSAAAASQPVIFNAAFDNANALPAAKRDVKAAYGEISFPIFNELEITAAARIDEYEGFGTTTNPKVTAKFRPVEWLMFRGSYNTGFRVATFNQIFNGVTESPLNSASTGDPALCPNGIVTAGVAGCVSIASQNSNAVSVTRGNLNVGPEESTQYSAGVVFQPTRHFSASLDFWSIDVDGVIGAPTVQEALRYASFFPSRIVRAPGTNIIQAVDLQIGNLGLRSTKGLEVVLRGGFDVAGGTLTAGLDGTYLIEKKEKLVDVAPWEDRVGVFTYAGDLGLKWKHNAFISWTDEQFNFSFSQIFRNGYRNNRNIAAALGRPDYNARVNNYIIYNLTAGVRVAPGFSLTAGVRNLLDTDPPFAITYDSATGAGSSWEPRVADPRGRSFTISTEVKF